MLGNGVHSGVGLLQGDAGFEAAHDIEPVKFVIDLFRPEG